MAPRVTVYVSPGHDLIHSSLVHAGFCALAERGTIALVYKRPQGSDAWLAADPIVVCFDVEGARSLRVALDLRDGGGLSQPIATRADRYVKRSFDPAERDRQPEAMRDKMLPFGLNFPCRTRASTWRLLSAIGLPLVAGGRADIGRLRHYLSTPVIAAFEQTPAAAVEPSVSFQTRLWRDVEVPAGESTPLNAERVAMVRSLRTAFGERFVGGLMPTDVAQERFPDLLTPHSSKKADYLARRKRCLVSVYTRGVEDSLAFKLGETLAASQCLVSVPLRYQLPRPLEEGRHYAVFTSTDECIAACRRLLDDPGRAQQMREANHEYYRAEVEPAAHLRNVLQRLGALSIDSRPS